ncbi:gene transfer agent family protein [Salinarimonas rosea]|uniref:gene transfer agent family protein n=1 Tax=Salinarimonas rosea TaxID=552063 RepID=UPI000425809F|nr:gene transfer agent family protein [Salinarimonas rosea]
MANARRGDVSVVIGGEVRTLRITLGALAELEDALAAEDLGALATRLAEGRLRARDLVAILGAALRGGGHPLADADVAALALEDGVEPVARAAMQALARAFGTDAEGSGAEAGANPPAARA